MAAVEIQGLSKRFGSVRAVSDLSFEVQAGRVTGFLGPNGAGKSTTIRMLLGLVHPDAGNAGFDGTEYGDLEHPSGHVGAVLEDASFHPGRTGRNHLRILAAAGRPPALAGGGGAGADRDRRRRQPARQGLLDGHAPAARDRRGAAGRPRGADPRRAGQRPGPSRHPLDARSAALGGRQGQGGPGLQPPALRGLPERRRHRRDLEGRAPRQRPDRPGGRAAPRAAPSASAPPTRRGSPAPWTPPGSRTARTRRGRCS